MMARVRRALARFDEGRGGDILGVIALFALGVMALYAPLALGVTPWP